MEERKEPEVLTLDLAGNALGAAGAASLSQGLGSLQRLRTLSLNLHSNASFLNPQILRKFESGKHSEIGWFCSLH